MAFQYQHFVDHHFLINSVPQLLFPSQLQDLLCSEQIQIVLGDFNTDAFDSNNYASLSNSLERYFMVVCGPTHLRESLINQVYLSNATFDNFQDKFQVTATIKNIYFSDHDAVNLELRYIH